MIKDIKPAIAETHTKGLRLPGGAVYTNETEASGSLQCYLDILGASPFAMCLIWGSQCQMFWNPACEKIAHFQPFLQHQGQRAEQVFSAYWPLLQPIADQVKNGQPFSAENIHVPVFTGGKTGSSFSCTACPIEPADGVYKGILLSVNHFENQETNNAGNQLESERQFRNLVLQSPVPMAILMGKEMCIELANPAILHGIWHREYANVKRQPLLTVFPELSSQPLPLLVQQVLETGETIRQNEMPELVSVNESASLLYVDILLAPLYHRKGSIEGVIITLNDVTAKVYARQQIEESGERLRLALEAGKMGTFDWDLQANKFYPSERLFEIFGLDPAQPISHQKFIDSFYPADKALRLQALETAMQTGSLDYELRIIKPDKRICWVKVFGKITYDAEQKPMRMHGTIQDITYSKTMLLDLEESRNRLNRAIDTAALGTYDVDILSGRVTGSERLYEIMGFAEGKKLTRQDVLNSVYPEDIATRNQAHQKALETGKVEYESRITWPDGSLHWIRINSQLLTDNEGTPYRILGTIMDITDQKNYIHQLEESEKRFRIVADSAPVMIWMSGTDGLCHFINKRWTEYTGRTMEQELGAGWLENVHPDDAQHCIDVYDDGFRRHTPFYMEYRLKKHNGEYRWIADSGIPRFDGNNEFVGYIGGCMDIDDQKKKNEKISKSEARLRIAALSGELGTWDYDPVSDEFYWDDACAAMFEKAYTAPASSQLFWSVVHPDDDPMLTELVRSALSDETAASFDAEFRVNCGDGRVKWVSAKGKSFFKEGQSVRFAGTVLDITEKKMALEALKESELLFKTIANAAPVGLWLTNKEGQVKFVNNTWQEWTGYTSQHATGSDWLEAIAPDDREFSRNKYIEAFTARTKMAWEFRLKNKLPEKRHYLNEGFPYYDNAGNFAGFAGSVTDISYQVNGMEALRKSEERFRLLSNAMPQLVWTADGEGHLNFFSKSALEYSGLTMQQMQQDAWTTFIHPAERVENRDKWWQSLKSGDDFAIEHRLHRADGVYRWHLSRAVAQKDNDGCIQLWIGTSTDIHDQKLMAEELENKVQERTAQLLQINTELIRQKEFVEIILDSSLIMVTVFDTDKRILAFNNKCEIVFNLQKENVIGKKLKEVFPTIVNSITYSNLNRALAGEMIHVTKYRSVVNQHFYESYFVPLRNNDGEIYAVLMTAHDITEIVDASDKVQKAFLALEQQNKALERSNRELESFSYVASHDLQEPLRKIQTFIELLHRSIDNKAEAEKYAAKISSSAQRMSALITDVLNYSRLTKDNHVFTSVDLNTIIENIKLDFELLIAEKQAVIECEKLPVVEGIPLQLLQLFSNLLSNALKFCKNAPVITIKYERIPAGYSINTNYDAISNWYHHIVFSDNGIGFEQQFAEKIFTIFQRLHNREYSGTGIGLALCKKIIENHNGLITAESTPGNGATFHIYLPAS